MEDHTDNQAGPSSSAALKKKATRVTRKRVVEEAYEADRVLPERNPDPVETVNRQEEESDEEYEQ